MSCGKKVSQLGELCLFARGTWAEECVLAQEDIFAKGLTILAIFSHFAAVTSFFDGSDAFPIALRAEVSFRKFFVHPILIYGSNF